MSRLPADDDASTWARPGERFRAGRRWAWHLLQVLIAAAIAHLCWRLFREVPYLIDADVYRMGGQAWLQGRPLYADGATFQTQVGLGLPFTYPPLAAVTFAPLALVSLPTASLAITALTGVLLVVSTWIVLTRLDVAESWPVGGSARLRRWWLAAGLVALAAWWFEPLLENFRFGQVNVILMTLVIADCVPRRTPWPRGLLLGLAIALKLTPAVFLLYFVLRRDIRAVLVAVASFGAATLAGFALAWSDSWEYWTSTVHNTDRIGTPTLNTNQNAAGALARLELGQTTHFLLWAAACMAVLALTVWAVRRVLASGTDNAPDSPDSGAPDSNPDSVLAVMCVALFGLIVSPVSWSHHWVWTLPVIVVAAVLSYQHRDPVLAVVAAGGAALMVWSPVTLLPEHQEAEAVWWRQLFGMSYVWWALAFITVAGLRSGPRRTNRRRSAGSAPTADLVRPA